MKRINISAMLLAALLSVSCGEKIDTDASQHAIGFTTLSTKAGQLDMPAGTFTVAGKYSAGSTFNAASAMNVFDSALQNVQTDGTGACTYSPVKYWKSSSTYRFRAVSPMAPDQVNYSDDLNGNAVITNFTVNASADSQKDLLLSDMVERQTTSPIGTPVPVEMVFRHLLCKVYVQIIENANEPLANPGSDEFNVTGVSLTGMPDKGTYTGTSTAGSWNTSSAGALACVNNTPHIAPENYDDTDSDATKANIWANGLLLIPQTVNSANAVNLVLSYQFRHVGGDWSNKSVSIPVPDITWEAGKVYTYQLAMSEESYIQFGSIIVDEWGSTQASGSVIIK